MKKDIYKNLQCLSFGVMATGFGRPDDLGDGGDGFYKYQTDIDNSNLAAE